MDQGGYRCGALHRIWQPDVQRHLSRLACGTDQEEQSDRRGQTGAELGPRSLEDPRIREGAEGGEHQHEADHEAEVPDPVHHEGLLGCTRGRWPGEPEADQQIGAEAYQFPAEKEHRVVTGEDEGEHRGGEEVEIGEEAVESLVAVHVADGEDVDQGPDPGHDQHHQRRQRIPQDFHGCSDGGHPLVQHHRRAVLTALDERDGR